MNIDSLNTRLAELSTFRKQLESQICMIDGHIQEVRYQLNELNKPVESQDGQANIEPTEQPASEGVCATEGAEVSH